MEVTTLACLIWTQDFLRAHPRLYISLQRGGGVSEILAGHHGPEDLEKPFRCHLQLVVNSRVHALRSKDEAVSSPEALDLGDEPHPSVSLKLAELDGSMTETANPELEPRPLADLPAVNFRALLVVGFHSGKRVTSITAAKTSWTGLCMTWVSVTIATTAPPTAQCRREAPGQTFNAEKDSRWIGSKSMTACP